MQHQTVPANSTNYTFSILFHNYPLPNLVVIGLVSEADFAGGYNRNPFNFQNFEVNRMELHRDNVIIPTLGYTPNFTDNHYIKDYYTMLAQLNLDKGDKALNISPSEWAAGYTLYAFKTTDGPIGSGTEGPRSRASEGVIGLNIGFATAPTSNVKVIVFSQSIGVIEIDSHKQVVLT